MVNIWRDRLNTFKEPYLMRFSRWFSYPFTVLFYRVKFISPNAISFFSLLVGLFSAILLLGGNYVLAGIIYWFSYILDLSDGEIARLRNKASKFGAWFDGILDRIKEFIIIIAASIVLYLQEPSLFVFVLALLAVLGGLFWRYSALYTKTTFDTGESKPKGRYKLIGFDVAFQNLLISLLILFNQLVILLLLFAVLLNLVWLKNMFFWVLRYRKI